MVFRDVAQLVEHRSPKPGVASSSLAIPATFRQRHRKIQFVFAGLTAALVVALVISLGLFLTPYTTEVANMPHEAVEETPAQPVPEPVKSEPEPVANDNAVKLTPVTHGGNASKIVYLTFDDGPSVYTGKLLDVLKKYGAKATFFVTCAGDDGAIKREYDEGHTVALHTCSHNYARVYASDAAFFADLDEVKARVKRLTGTDATLIRFPGGSSNTVSANYSRGIMSRLSAEVGRRGYTYFDWNVSSGDAGGATTADAVYNNVVSGIGKYPAGAVVLQHDVKGFSVDAVERILQYGKENGFTFERLTASSNTAHHGVNN